MRAGRPRKTTKMKELQGTLEKSRVSENELSTSKLESVPDLDSWYPIEVLELWNRLAKEFIKVGLLEVGDIEPLKAYCVACYMRELAFKKMVESDFVVEYTNKAGATNKVKNPWNSILNEATGVMNTLSGKFGFSPADRAKLEMPKDEGQDDNPLNAISKLMNMAAKEKEIELKKVG